MPRLRWPPPAWISLYTRTDIMGGRGPYRIEFHKLPEDSQRELLRALMDIERQTHLLEKYHDTFTARVAADRSLQFFKAAAEVRARKANNGK